jgi:methionyl-tRNA formyltransferase
VTAHHVDPTFDTGDVIEKREFAIDPERETAWSLEMKSHDQLLSLFRDVLALAGRPGALPRHPQGPGRTITKKDFEKLRRISPDDTPEQIERKIRAFWRPRPTLRRS